MSSLATSQALAASRVQLHYAIQFMAATGAALAEPQPDYSHVSLGWLADLKLFSSALIPAAIPFRVALDPVNLVSLLLDAEGHTLAALPLDQKTLAEGLTWLKEEVAHLGADADKITLLSYPDDFPDSAIAHGAAFNAEHGEEDRQQLVDYYALTHTLLQEVVSTTPTASPVWIWPHHFDMATLISIPGTTADETKSIGVGLSPGDGSYNEPYWYVSPYPYPPTDRLPPLEGSGFWHTDHWVGAVLRASQLVSGNLGDEQQKQVRVFLQTAIAASQTLLNHGH